MVPPKHKTALSNPTGPVFELTPELLNEGIEASRQSPRLRMILPIHRQQDSLVQRMLNFLQPGTYVQPHVHPREYASETVFVMRGRIGFAIFNEAGELQSTHDLTKGGLIDIEPNVWHGMVCLEPDTVILETKRGPYDLMDDKHFAGWAPAEGDDDAPEYMQELEQRFTIE